MMSDAPERIEELEAQLAEVTAERDRLDAAIKRQAGAAKTLRQHTLAEVQHIKDNQHKAYVASRTLDSEREANAILTDEVDTLTAKLAEVTAERDGLRRTLHDETVALGCMKFRAEAAEAMLPAAYRAGVDDTLREQHEFNAVALEIILYGATATRLNRLSDLWDKLNVAIRALATPTIEQLKEMLKENGDE